MEMSKIKISKRVKRKTNTKLVETIELAKKNNLLDLAKKLSSSTRLQSKVNLEDLNKLKEDKIMVLGKILGKGNIETKKEVIALSFSESAIEKLKKSGSKTITIREYIKDHKTLKEIKII